MSDIKTCDEKIKTEKDEKGSRLLRMQKRAGLVCDKVTRKLSSLKLSPVSARPTICARAILPSRFVACFVWFFKVASMTRECRLDGVWRVIVVALIVAGVGGSEFPERECCDPVYPQNTAPTTVAAPVTPPVQTSIKLTGEFRVVDYLYLNYAAIFFFRI